MLARDASTERMMVRVMANEAPGQPPRSRWMIAALLAGLIIVAGTLGALVALVQRPSTLSPQKVTELPTSPTVPPTPVPGGPVLGFGFSVADDPATHFVILFGGIDSYAATWLWDGNQWTLVRPAVSPPGRFGAAAAYDPVARQVMLFGGRLGAGEVVNDTWSWDGANWHELDSGSGGPPAGEGSLMAWDNATGQMVLVTPAAMNAGSETWVWAGSHWVRRPGGDLPPGAYGTGMSFDPVSRALLFVGTAPPKGAGTSTWRWSGSTWHDLPVSISAAPAGVALDPSSGRLWLCGTTPGASASQLWKWSGLRWAPIPNSELPIQTEAATSDLIRDQFLILGWRTQPNQGSPQPLQLWWWSGQGWLQSDVAA
jgi:hypothetical protein